MADKSAAKPVEPIHRGYHGCSSLKEYELVRKLGEGTFGEVYQADRKDTGEVVALKKILMHNEKDGFPITALREIKLLKTLNHVNIIKLEEMAVERTKELKKRATLYMVTPYMEHDLSGMLDNPEINVTEPMRKCYMLQLFHGLNYLHQSYILHRDMKAANLLISNGGVLKIADFGLARHYDGPLPQRHRGGGEATRDYTSLVVTRWYRPPELLLNLRRYTTAIDMWGAGCVFGEMYKRKPILTGQSDLHQAQIIFELVGSPNAQSMPGWDSLPGADSVKNMEKSYGRIDEVFKNLDHQALSLLKDLLKLDWRTRINAMDAVEHPYFTTPPLPARPEDIPQFKDSHELDRRNHRPNKALPPAPQGGTVGGGGVNGEWQGDTNGGPPYHDRWSQDRGAGGHRDRDYHGSRVPGRDHGNGSRGVDRDWPNSRVPAAGNDYRGDNRRPAWQQGDSRHNGESNGSRGATSLPPPPGEGSRHPLPMNPHRSKKDTYIPSYSGPAEREERRSRTPERHRERYDDRRGDRYRGERRPRDEFRDRDAPREDRYRERREGGRRERTRSPDRDRSRDRGVDSYRER